MRLVGRRVVLLTLLLLLLSGDSIQDLHGAFFFGMFSQEVIDKKSQHTERRQDADGHPRGLFIAPWLSLAFYIAARLL
jgi:hypothetical protein